MGEEFLVLEIRCDLCPGDCCVRGEIGETLWNGMIGGLEEEDAAFAWEEFTVAVAPSGGLGEGVEA